MSENNKTAEKNYWYLHRHQFIQTGDQGQAGRSLSEKMFEKRRVTILDKESDKVLTYSHFRFDSSVILSGINQPDFHVESLEPLKSVVINTPLQGEIIDHTQGQDVSYLSGEAIVMSPGEYANLTRINYSSGLGVIVLGEKLAEHLNQHYGIEVNESIKFDRRLNLCRGLGKSLMSLLHYICSEADDETSPLSLGITKKSIEDLLITTILECVTHNFSELMHKKHKHVHPVHVKRAVDYIMDNLHLPIQLNDLVRESGVTARSLQLGFKDTYGLSPMGFIRDVRLKRVRDSLLEARPGSVTIADIAEYWQFSHHSQFTKMYQKRFGELPSRTINR